MSGDGIRWVYDPGDSFAHVLADPAAAPAVLVTVCGRELPAERTPTFPVAPSLAICPVCSAGEPAERTARPPVASPPMPDGARRAEARQWHALNRAHEAAVVKLTDDYVDAGCPVAGDLADTFDELIAAGLLGLGPPSAGGSRRVCVTHTGQARYALLRTGPDTKAHEPTGKQG
ncbi:MAG: hypothetical protein ACRDTE_06990 [Pseudonocardiaceae bacterium]